MNDVDLSAEVESRQPDEATLPRNDAELWEILRLDAARVAAREPSLRSFMDLAVLRYSGFAPALAALLSRKLAEGILPEERLVDLAATAMAEDPDIVASAVSDLVATRTRDPAAESFVTPFLYYKGYHALEWHRIGHWLFRHRRRDMAYFLQSRMSAVFAIDIHPRVPVGKGVFIDHGTGIVIGETSTIGNDVSILQGVTLGGTGKERGDRHPKVRDGVLISVGAKVLGNIELGRGAKIGAGSVVLKDVPPCATVAGVPARIVGWCAEVTPALAMDQSLPETKGAEHI